MSFIIIWISFLIRRKEDKGYKKLIRNESKNGDLFRNIFSILWNVAGKRTTAARMIHIHRNTLNYRLQKIEEITGLEFDNYIEFIAMR